MDAHMPDDVFDALMAAGEKHVDVHLTAMHAAAEADVDVTAREGPAATAGTGGTKGSGARSNVASRGRRRRARNIDSEAAPGAVAA